MGVEEAKQRTSVKEIARAAARTVYYTIKVEIPQANAVLRKRKELELKDQINLRRVESEARQNVQGLGFCAQVERIEQ